MLVEKRLKKQKSLVVRKVLHKQATRKSVAKKVIRKIWRSVKYEEVYLYGYKDGKCAYQGLKKYFAYYNTERRHENLDYEIPAEFYELHKKKAA